jgi:hypothetical protein
MDDALLSREPKRMLCPECQRDGEKSRVSEGVCWSDAVYRPGYHDEDGRYHAGTPVRLHCTYSCSRGHQFVVER